MRLVKMCDSNHRRYLVEALTELEQLLDIKNILGGKLRTAINDVKGFNSYFDLVIRQVDDNIIIKLLLMVDSGEYPILSKFKETLLDTYYLNNLGKGVFTAFKLSAMNDGYRINDSKILLNDGILNDIFNILIENKNIFDDELKANLFTTIVYQVSKKDSSQVKDTLKKLSVNKDWLKYIFLPGDKDYAYRIKTWLFISNKSNLDDYKGANDVLKDGILSEVKYNGEDVKLFNLRSEQIRQFLNQFLSKNKVYLEDWFKDNISSYKDANEKSSAELLLKFIIDNNGSESLKEDFQFIVDNIDGKDNDKKDKIEDYLNRLLELKVESTNKPEDIIEKLLKFDSNNRLIKKNNEDDESNTNTDEDSQLNLNNDESVTLESLLNDLNKDQTYIKERMIELIDKHMSEVGDKESRKVLVDNLFSQDDIINLKSKKFTIGDEGTLQLKFDSIINKLLSDKVNTMLSLRQVGGGDTNNTQVTK